MHEILEPTLTPKELRASEVATYTANIVMYKTLIATLDGNWDSDLIYLKDVEIQEAARQCPMDKL